MVFNENQSDACLKMINILSKYVQFLKLLTVFRIVLYMNLGQTCLVMHSSQDSSLQSLCFK